MQAAGEDWDVIEECFVTFLELGNIFAVVRSGQSAPPPAAVGEWLALSRVVPNIAWTVIPLIDEARFERVRQLGEATWVRVTARPPALPRGRTSQHRGLFRSLATLRDVGELKVEVKLSVGKRSASQAERQRIGGEALDILDIIAESPDAIESAEAKIPSDPDPIDLLQHHLTHKRTVEFQLLPRNRSLNEHAVFTFIDAVIVSSIDEIRAIIGQ